jgi:hypothetical protein
MPTTFHCQPIRPYLIGKTSALQNCAVHLRHPYRLTPDECERVLLFETRKAALEFSDKWSLPKSNIVKTRVETVHGWIIGLGQQRFVPALAEGYLFAHAMNFNVVSTS